MLDELILFSNCFSFHFVRLVAAPEQLESMEVGDITTSIEVHVSNSLLFVNLFCPLIPFHTLVLASQCMSDATFHGKPFSSTHSEPFLHALLETKMLSISARRFHIKFFYYPLCSLMLGCVMSDLINQ